MLRAQASTEILSRLPLNSASAAMMRNRVLVPTKTLRFPWGVTPTSCPASCRYLSTSATPFAVASSSTSPPFRSQLSPSLLEPKQRAQMGQYQVHTFHEPEPSQPAIHGLFHDPTSTWTYIVLGLDRKTCVVIDPVLDFDLPSFTVSTSSADALLNLIKEKGWKVSHLLETHAHADHLTSAHYLRNKLSKEGLAYGRTEPKVPVCIGAGIAQVQQTFASRYGLETITTPKDFDILFRSGPPPTGSPHGATDSFLFGGSQCAVMHLPGHTPDHVGYLVGGNLFCGDVIFQPDVGSARADFPGGSAESLYGSLQTLLSLPSETNIFVGHDYPPAPPGDPEGPRREPRDKTTVGIQRALNIHLQGLGCPVEDGKVEPECRHKEFLRLRSQRDASLSTPKLLHASLQVNIRAGRLPPSGFFRMPVTLPLENQSDLE